MKLIKKNSLFVLIAFLMFCCKQSEQNISEKVFNNSDVYTLDVNQANYALNGTSISTGALLSSIGNPNLVWEKSISKNIGVDFSFLDSRLLWSFEYYQIETEGLIKQNLSTNPSTGADASAPFENIGTVKNSGRWGFE